MIEIRIRVYILKKRKKLTSIMVKSISIILLFINFDI